MTFDEFSASLRDETPPAGTPRPLFALWRDGKGDWTGAHEIAQDVDTVEGAMVHAYLHRKEGDLDNARYWYQRAGRPVADVVAGHRMEGAGRGDAAVRAMTASTGTTPATAPAPLPRVAAVRYVTPLREGGSVPALVEADDGKLYVVKMRGAGQGARVLIAELVAGRLGQALGLRVPALALVDLDAALARSEPDTEIQDILRASAGLNLGLAHLDGALTFDPGARQPLDADVASRVVLLDTFTTNVDRTARNPNLLWWRGELAPIDHGAALYWQHDWDGSLAAARPERAFPLVRDHVLLPWAGALDRRARWRRARSPTSSSTASPPRSPTSGWRHCRAPPTPRRNGAPTPTGCVRAAPRFRR